MGFSDIGFSSCAVPTYYPMSKYFRQRAKVWGLTPKNFLMGGEHHGRWVPEILGLGLSFQLSVLRGAIISEWVLTIDGVDQVLGHFTRCCYVP